MWKQGMTAVVLVAGLSWAVSAQDAQTVIANASKAIGADTLKTVEYSATGFDMALGESDSPTTPWPKWINKTYTRQLDFERSASKVDRIRMQGEKPMRGGSTQPMVGEVPATQTIIVGPSTPWVQQLEIVMLPQGFLRAAKANNATLSRESLAGKQYQVLTFTGQNKAAVKGYINDQNMVERVSTLIDNPFLGDMPFFATYTNYKDFGGTKFPTKIIVEQGGWPIWDLDVSDVKPNAAVNIQAPPPPATPAPAGPPPGTVATSVKVDEGIWRLYAQPYASLVLDFKDYLVVLEAPQQEFRAIAMLNEIHRILPNKRIGYVVNTHNHFDHIMGARAFVDEGATVITHEAHKAYYEKSFPLPHTLNPDRLWKSKKPLKLETMTEKKVLTDGNHVVELYHDAGSRHDTGLIFAYLPKQKILLEADVFSPPQDPNFKTPAVVSEFAVNMVNNIERLKLDVKTVVPVHYPTDGRTISVAELYRWVGRPTPGAAAN